MTSEKTQKPILAVSIPIDQRHAFYAALAQLKRQPGNLFKSTSALVVETVIEAAKRLEKADNSPPHEDGMGAEQ